MQLFVPSIQSCATHNVTGRGTIKVVLESDGPYRVGRYIKIDGTKYIITGIERTSPPSMTCGLVVKHF